MKSTTSKKVNINFNSETDSADDFCHCCKKEPIDDIETALCQGCYNRLCDAIDDTLPNLSPDYNHNMTTEERDRIIDQLGEEFGLSPQEIRNAIDK